MLTRGSGAVWSVCCLGVVVLSGGGAVQANVLSTGGAVQGRGGSVQGVLFRGGGRCCPGGWCCRGPCP